MVTAKGSEWEGLNGERAREIEADRVHICFGSRECSDGFLCQHHLSGAELNCGTKSEKREAVHRGEQDEAYIWRAWREEGRNEGRQLCVCVCVKEGVNESEWGNKNKDRTGRRASYRDEQEWQMILCVCVCRGLCVCSLTVSPEEQSRHSCPTADTQSHNTQTHTYGFLAQHCLEGKVPLQLKCVCLLVSTVELHCAEWCVCRAWH